jgi:hypothetical protein
MEPRYTVGTVFHRELETDKIIKVEFRIFRRAGHRDVKGNWALGQARRSGEINEISREFDLTEDEAKELMTQLGVKLAHLERERNGRRR